MTGNEGLDCLLKTAYEKAYYPKGNYAVFRKVIGEASKNHQAGSEDLTNSGLIPFCANEFGFNPGALLETYLEVLNPAYEFKIASTFE